MEEGGLAPCPVWSDVSTFDGRPWRGVVDLVAGGFPCQDISNAGKRAGIGGERSGLWSHFARIVGEVRPRFVFVENVAALAARGLDVVLGDLAALGFDAEWGCLGADDAGAPHGRERLFILADAGRERVVRVQSEPEPRRGGAPAPRGTREGVAHALCDGLEGLDAAGATPRAVVGGGSAPLADPDGARSHRVHERFQPRHMAADASGRGVGRPACVAPWPPGPDDAAGWRAYLDRWPGTEPAVRRGADGLARRVDRLRLLGNGVVPDQAELAWHVLRRRLHGG
jgi:DNA (cytosine-5)-methyltransferase 1